MECKWQKNHASGLTSPTRRMYLHFRLWIWTAHPGGMPTTDLEARGVETGNWRVDERRGQKFQVFFVN